MRHYTTDAATNANDALTFLHAWDYAAPTPSITSTAADPTRASPIPVTIEWSEAVSPNITLADLNISGVGTVGTAGNFRCIATGKYELDLTPTSAAAEFHVKVGRCRLTPG